MTGVVSSERRHFVSVVGRHPGDRAALDRFWVRVYESGTRTTVLGPAEIARTGLDGLDLARIDDELRAAGLARSSAWEPTAQGYVAWLQSSAAIATEAMLELAGVVE